MLHLRILRHEHDLDVFESRKWTGDDSGSEDDGDDDADAETI